MGSSRLSKCTGLLGAQEFPGSSPGGPRAPPRVFRFSRFSMGSSRLSKCTGLLGAQEFPGSSRFFQGCHSLQAFSGAPRKSSQAFSGAPGSVVRVHRRFQGLPQLDAPRSFPRRSQGSTQGFQIFQVFHGFFQVVKVYRPPRGPGVPRFFPGALKSESSREILNGLGRRRGKRN